MQEERELPRLKKQEKKEEGKMRRKMSNLVLAQFFSLSIKHFTPAVHNSLLVKKKKMKWKSVQDLFLKCIVSFIVWLTHYRICL